MPQCFGTPDEIQLGAFCVSEPDAGSDVSSLKTKAVYDEASDEWVLNGTKAWITNGGIADVHVVVATVDPELKGRGQASFVIPPGTSGLSQGQKYRKHGIRASHTAEVVLDDVRIPGRLLLGGKDKLDEKLARAREQQKTGAKQPAMATFEATRPAVGAMAVGIARAAYEYALGYAKERVAFGKPIIMNQAIAFMLADMATEIDAARLLVHRAAWLARNGGYTNAEGSMSKLKAGRTAVWVTERAIQILGGYGYTREYPVERFHRDAKIYDIFEGTEQIQQLVICAGDQRPAGRVAHATRVREGRRFGPLRPPGGGGRRRCEIDGRVTSRTSYLEEALPAIPRDACRTSHRFHCFLVGIVVARSPHHASHAGSRATLGVEEDG